MTVTRFPQASLDMIPPAVKQFLCAIGVRGQANSWAVENGDGKIQLKLTWNINNQGDQEGTPYLRPMRYKTPSTIKRDQQRLAAHLVCKQVARPDSSGTPSDMELGVVKEKVSDQTNDNPAPNVNHLSESGQPNTVILSDLSHKPDPCDVGCQSIPEVSDRGQQMDCSVMHTIATQTGAQFNGCNDREHRNCKIAKVLRTKIEDWSTYEYGRGFERGRRTAYLVNWTDHSPKQNTWVTEDRLDETTKTHMKNHPVPGVTYEDYASY